MKTPLINPPELLANASREAAKDMDISRTKLMRQAILHEAKLEEQRMVSSMKAMKESKDYRKEADDITEGFSIDLPAP